MGGVISPFCYNVSMDLDTIITTIEQTKFTYLEDGGSDPSEFADLLMEDITELYTL